MAGGKPSGVFVDAAMSLVDSAKPKPLRARPRPRAVCSRSRSCCEQGITAIADMGTSILDWQAYRRAGDKKQLAVRILSYAGDIDNMAMIAGREPDAVAVRRPAADGRGEALPRRRARFARRVAQGAV